METLLIRAARLSDLGAIDEIARESALHHQSLDPSRFSTAPLSAVTLEADVKEGTDSTYVCVASAQGTIVGFAHVVQIEETRPLFSAMRYALVHAVAVRASHRGQSIGTQLIAETERWAKARGCREVRLHVWAANERAAQLYEALGYQPIASTLAKNL